MKLHEELTFKDNTLDFTHTVLVKSEKAKIELEQEKKMLEEMINNQEGGPINSNEEDLSEFYEHQIGELERKLGAMQKHHKEKDEEHRFELKQQKERIRELNDMLLSKERRITPETMSQEETVAFLTKTLRRVIRSSDMLRILERHHDFRENLTRMER